MRIQAKQTETTSINKKTETKTMNIIKTKQHQVKQTNNKQSNKHKHMGTRIIKTSKTKQKKHVWKHNNNTQHKNKHRNNENSQQN